MLIVRRNTFETNSSSTHSLVMCSGDEYDLLEKKEAFLVGESTVVKKEDLITEWLSKNNYKKREWEKFCQEHNLDSTDPEVLANNIINGVSSYDYDEDDLDEGQFIACFDVYEVCTLDQFWEYYEERLEGFTDEYTTKSGEKVIAFGVYGMDC